MRSTGNNPTPRGLVLLLGALGYFALARLGLGLASLNASVSPVWPASGFALALLITYGRAAWPAIALGAFCANALTGGILTAIPITAGNTLEAVAGLWIYRRLSGINPDQLPIARSISFAAASLLAPLISAGVGVFTLASAGVLANAAAGDIALTWWAGDVLGILLLAPLLTALHQAKLHLGNLSATPQNLLRFLGLIAATVLTAALAFFLPGWDAAIFLSLPIILFAARWHGCLGSAFLVLLTGALWLAGSTAGSTVGGGPFAEMTLNNSLLEMQIMLAALAVAALVLSEVAGPHFAAADIVFLLGSLIISLIFVTVTQSQADIDERHFQNVTTRIASQLSERMDLYVSALQGGASLYAASRDVRRAEWRAYVDSLDIFRRHPGINAIGIVVPADSTALGSFIADERKDGLPDFNVRPVPGISSLDAAFPQHFVVIYAEPMAINRAAIGLDLASEPNRRATAIAARDTGQPKISGRITLVQTGGPGFLLLVPMYREPLSTLTPASMRWSFHGWVYASFSADGFFRSVLPAENTEVRLQVYDAAKPEPGDIMFDSLPGGNSLYQPTPFTAEMETQLPLFGRTFTLRWQRGAGFESQSHQMPVQFSAGLILFITLLTALIATLMSQKERATAIARQMNAALATSNERFALAVACSQDGIWDYDLITGEVWTSPRYKEMYGYGDVDTGDHWEFWRSIIEPEDHARSRGQYDEMMSGAREGIDLIQRYHHRDGRLLHVHSRALTVRDADNNVTRVIGVHTDISLVVRLERQLRDAINVMADGFAIFDPDDRLVLFNDGFVDAGTRKAIGDPTGCTFEEVVRAFVEHDMPDAKDPTFDREAWITQRMERHRTPPKDPIEVKWGGERWMRISERRTADGGYVGVWTDVTEIKRLGQRLRDAIGALGDGFALFDADDRLVAYNDAFLADSTKKKAENPTGRTFEDLYRSYARDDLGLSDLVELEDWLRTRLQLHREPPALPYEVRTPDGSYHRILERRTSDGGTVGIWSDVTTERRAQHRLRDAIDALSDGFALFDPDDRLVIFNEGFMSDSLRTTFGDPTGHTFEEIYRVFAANDSVMPDEADRERWLQERLALHRDPPELPYEFAGADGRWTRILERRTSEGGWVGTWTDVTSERVAERRLNDAIDNINEGFVLVDAEGRYVLFNEEFLRLYPKTAPYVEIGASFENSLRQAAIDGEYPGLHTPDAIEAFVTEWTQRFRDPAAFHGEGAFADGRWVLIAHHGTSDGGSVNVYTDITAMKQRESDLADTKTRLERQAAELIATSDELRLARQAADAANHSKSQFLADMSHELRTPLNGILGFADIIRGEMFGKIEQPRYTDYAGDIHASGTHLLQLINDLLDLSKIEANRMTVTVEAVSMPDVVSHATRLVGKLAEDRGVIVSVPDKICPVIHADERQARQILLNLLSNAVKFTDAGGTVTLRAVEEGDAGIVVTVSDTGVGMTEAELKKALERFGQVENNLVKSLPGTGLGLPLVAALVKLHNGTFDITSKKGIGTTVTIRLPWQDGLYRAA